MTPGHIADGLTQLKIRGSLTTLAQTAQLYLTVSKYSTCYQDKAKKDWKIPDNQLNWLVATLLVLFFPLGTETKSQNLSLWSLLAVSQTFYTKIWSREPFQMMQGSEKNGTEELGWRHRFFCSSFFPSNSQLIKKGTNLPPFHFSAKRYLAIEICTRILGTLKWSCFFFFFYHLLFSSSWLL